MIITHSIHIQLFYSYSSFHSIHHIQSSHNQSIHFIVHSRDSNQFLSFHITINQTSILILISFIPQFRSPITPFPISPFHSFHSTFTFIYLNPLLLSFVLITIISVISVCCTNQTEIFVHSYQSFSSVSHSNA